MTQNTQMIQKTLIHSTRKRIKGFNKELESVRLTTLRKSAYVVCYFKILVTNLAVVSIFTINPFNLYYFTIKSVPNII